MEDNHNCFHGTKIRNPTELIEYPIRMMKKLKLSTGRDEWYYKITSESFNCLEFKYYLRWRL